jgi:hypothetical protein
VGVLLEPVFLHVGKAFLFVHLFVMADLAEHVGQGLKRAVLVGEIGAKRLSAETDRWPQFAAAANRDGFASVYRHSGAAEARGPY